MFTKIKNIITWPFRVDNRTLSDIGFKKSILLIVFLVAAIISFYKAATYYYDIYYLPIDAEMAVNDYFVQDNYDILQGVYTENFRVVSAAVNLHFNSIKEKPQIVTVIEPPYQTEDLVVERANQLFNEIGIGSAEYNNGVLIYISGNRNLSFKIEVGYGLEEVLTDSKSGMILDKAFEQIGGKDNLNKDNLNKVLLYIFTEIANIVAEKYNVDISKDLNVSNYNDIVYHEPLDDLGLFLKYYMIILGVFLLLIIFSKRYVVMVILFPMLSLGYIVYMTGDILLMALFFIFFPIVYVVYLTDNKKKSVNIKKSNNKTSSNKDIEDKKENLDKADEISSEKSSKKAVENNPVKRNLLSLTLIPSTLSYDYKHMSYQFVLFYSFLFIILAILFVDIMDKVDLKLINEEFIHSREATVDEKLDFYTNVNGEGGYEKQGVNTYVLDNTFDKEIYGINYLFQQSKEKPKIVALIYMEDNFSKPISAEKLFTKYKLDKLENNNGLLIFYSYHLHTYKSKLEIIAGDGLKTILTDMDIEEIKINALKHSYNAAYELNIDDNTVIKEPDNYLSNKIERSIAKAEQILGENNDKEKDKDKDKEAARLDSVISLLNSNGNLSRINLIMTYTTKGNGVKVLQEAVEQSANIIAKAYNINLNDDKLLSYYTLPYEKKMSKKCKDSLIILAIFVPLFLLVLGLIVLVYKSLFKLALNGLLASLILYLYYDNNAPHIIIMIFFIILILALLLFAGVNSSSDSSSGGGFSFKGSSGGRSFSRSGRSSSGFGGFSRSRSRSFRGGGRSGGGGSFRR